MKGGSSITRVRVVRIGLLVFVLFAVLFWWKFSGSSSRQKVIIQDQDHHQKELQQVLQDHGLDLPLRNDLGKHHWRIRTVNPLAQRYFDQAFRFVLAYDMVRARDNFIQAQKLDPECVMCHWGEAFARGQNLNADQDEEEEIVAFAAALRALMLTIPDSDFQESLRKEESSLVQQKKVLTEIVLHREAWKGVVESLLVNQEDDGEREGLVESSVTLALMHRYHCPIFSSSQKKEDFIQTFLSPYMKGNALRVQVVHQVVSSCLQDKDLLMSRKELNGRYAQAMWKVSELFPASDDILFLTADAQMNVSPWDYWKKSDENEPISLVPNADLAYEKLQTIMQRNKNHAGALHLFVHLTEAGPHPEEALEAADRLSSLLPGSPHLQHMPSHTYIRLGKYDLAAYRNERALDLPIGLHVYPQHNMEFLMYSLIMQGKNQAAWREALRLSKFSSHVIRQLEKESSLSSLKQSSASSTKKSWPLPPLEAGYPVERFIVAPLHCAVVFGHYGFILSYPQPPAQQYYHRAVYHWARGLAHLARADGLMENSVRRESLREGGAIRWIEEAFQEYEALLALKESMSDEDLGMLYGQAFPVERLMRILECELEAELSFHVARGQVLSSREQEGEFRSTRRVSRPIAGQARTRAADEALAEAMQIEYHLDYDEPPTQHFPVAHRLGAALIRKEKLEEAKRVYLKALTIYPDDGWVLFGLAQVKNDSMIWNRFLKAFSESDITLLNSYSIQCNEKCFS